MEQQRIDTFLNLQGQTNPSPYLIDVEKAEGIYIWDKSGKRYMDMIAGVAVNNIGHRHPQVVKAIKEQLDKYLHVMVYGEYIQDAQLALAENLASVLPASLSCSYIVNSGTEANEAAVKLAKRVTQRKHIVACEGAYHGSTHGSLSFTNNETKKAAFTPLLPNVDFIKFNDIASLEVITEATACVLIETIQGDAGLIKPTREFIQALRNKCTEKGALLIFDEVQVGMGRTGKMFAFEHYNVVPDILTLGKALGGGMPIGAFVASHEMMHTLTHNPVLGHITTFGGNPVIAAAALATLQELTETDIVAQTLEKEKLFRKLLKHPLIKEIRGRGLMLAVILETPELATEVILECKNRGLVLFWLLFEGRALRITPPLTISNDEIAEGCTMLHDVLNRCK